MHLVWNIISQPTAARPVFGSVFLHKHMAPPSPDDRALIVLALLLLPLNFLSFIHRSLQQPNGSRSRCIRPAVLSVLLISLSTILALSDLDPQACATSELDEMKLQVAKLESLLDEKSAVLDSKILELEQSNVMVEEMDRKIDSLRKTLDDARVSYGGFSIYDEEIRTMAHEVQQLWDESRRNNFKIHVSESKMFEAEKKVEAVASKVEKIQSIVSEQWIQIQQLEQSLQMTKVMTSRVNQKISPESHKKSKSHCPMSKLRRSIARHSHSQLVGLPDSFLLGGTISRSSLLKATKHFKRIMSSAQKQHHELQYSVKLAMEMNEYIAPLANKEFVFFVASALIVFPMMMAWGLCSAFFG